MPDRHRPMFLPVTLQELPAKTADVLAVEEAITLAIEAKSGITRNPQRYVVSVGNTKNRRFVGIDDFVVGFDLAKRMDLAESTACINLLVGASMYFA